MGDGHEHGYGARGVNGDIFIGHDACFGFLQSLRSFFAFPRPALYDTLVIPLPCLEKILWQ